MYTEKELLDKKKEIEEAKIALAENKGEEKSLLKQLEKKWGCKTLLDAKKKLKSQEKEILLLEEEIKEKSNKLEALLKEEEAEE